MLNNLTVSLEAAAKKDTGLTPAQLTWVLNQIKLGNDLTLPNGITVAELRDYLESLISRLTQISFPNYENKN